MEEKIKQTIFKGFSKENHKWIEGSYFKSCIASSDTMNNTPKENNEIYKHYISTGTPINLNIPNQIIGEEVFPQSVSISTDIYDINGKRMFSHDIIKADDEKDLFVVIFHGTEFLLHPYIEDCIYITSTYADFEDFSKFEIMTNTFDVAYKLVEDSKKIK